MYSTISNLGSTVDYHTDHGNPLTYCLYPNYNAQWIHGPTSNNLLYTPQCENCQIYMSERCAKDFDEYCQTYYDANRDTSWPNLAAIDVQSQKKANQFLKYTPTTGENMIRNSVEKNLFIYPSVIQNQIQFDPNVVSSPFITRHISNTFAPSWVLNPNVQINNNNKHINIMLKYPHACFDLLARFHTIMKTQPEMLTTVAGKTSNSNLTSFLKQNDELFGIYNKL